MALCLLLPVLSHAQTSDSLKTHQPTVYLVANAHLDTQWNWDIQKTINEYIPATIYRNLLLLDQFPNYIFNCESGFKYALMKEYHPEAFERVRQYVKEGRWHVSGSCWEASDGNIPSPESLTRNILYGQDFYKKEFGVLSTDIFLPDCFGFGWQMPTIASHCGLIGFSSQKLIWRDLPFYGDSKVPFEFGEWIGIDGSSLLAFTNPGRYGRKFQNEDISYNKEIIKAAGLTPQGINVLYYGTGDIGGSPTPSSVMAVEKGIAGSGPVKIISATSDQLFLDILKARELGDNSRGLLDIPTVNGELTMDVHGTGCYTSQAAMKLLNRRNEQAADAAERASVVAEVLTGAAYPSQTLTEGWKRFIWHQFHDDLTGTSIPRAYEFSWNDEIVTLKQFGEVLGSAVGAVAANLDTRVSGSPVVLYNPSGFDRTDVVTIDGCWSVRDAKGRKVACQNDGAKTSFVATVPALGFAVYEASASRANGVAAGKVLNERTGDALACIKNSIYSVSFDANGDICSIVDSRYGRELVADGAAFRLAMWTDNKSYRWPAWEIMKSTLDMEPASVCEDVRVQLVENGPVRKTVKVSRRFGESVFNQFVTLHEGADAERIDVRCEIDWASSGCLLKAEFPCSFGNPSARYDLGVGSVLRGNNQPNMYEVYAQKWADLSTTDGAYGVSILSDCKYGWDKPCDNTLRLTLLHTPATEGNYVYQDHQDLGHHEFTYAIVGHGAEGASVAPAATVAQAEKLDQPLKAFFAPKHKGSLGREYSFASVSGATLKAVKKAEDGSGYVLRFYNESGVAGRGAIRFARELASVVEVNGIEEEVACGAASGVGAGAGFGEYGFEGGHLSFEMKPFGVRSFRVAFEGAGAGLTSGAAGLADGIAAQRALELPFTVRTASYNSMRSMAKFDSKGHSFAAELLPSEIVHKGIRFTLANPFGPNAMRCNGSEIELPEGSWNSLYLLVASNSEDQRVCFKAGNFAQNVTVPSWSEFVGQWDHTGHTEGYIKGGDIAYVGSHRHDFKQDKDLAYEQSYLFCVRLDIPAGAKTVTLPENRSAMIFGAVVARDERNVLVPCGGCADVAIPAAAEPEIKDESGIFLCESNIIGRSGEVGDHESAEMLFDGDSATKWCDQRGGAPVWVDIDLKAVRKLSGYYIMHATHESANYTTKKFQILVKNSLDEEWQVADSVQDNAEPFNDKPLDVTARYVRLLVTQGAQSSTAGNTARIYEFMVY